MALVLGVLLAGVMPGVMPGGAGGCWGVRAMMCEARHVLVGVRTVGRVSGDRWLDPIVLIDEHDRH